MMSAKWEVTIVTGLRCVWRAHVLDLVCAEIQKGASSAPVGQGSKEMVSPVQMCSKMRPDIETWYYRIM